MWLNGDPGLDLPPSSRLVGRNCNWRHLVCLGSPLHPPPCTRAVADDVLCDSANLLCVRPWLPVIGHHGGH
jgi:hypothetical protein